jgi:hypothetical protein
VRFLCKTRKSSILVITGTFVSSDLLADAKINYGFRV